MDKNITYVLTMCALVTCKLLFKDFTFVAGMIVVTFTTINRWIDEKNKKPLSTINTIENLLKSGVL